MRLPSIQANDWRPSIVQFIPQPNRKRANLHSDARQIGSNPGMPGANHFGQVLSFVSAIVRPVSSTTQIAVASRATSSTAYFVMEGSLAAVKRVIARQAVWGVPPSRREFEGRTGNEQAE